VKRILNGPERLWVLFDNRAAWREQETKEIGPERRRLLFSASLRPVTEKKTYRDEWITKKKHNECSGGLYLYANCFGIGTRRSQKKKSEATKR
jgi:hypothetical protein